MGKRLDGTTKLVLKSSTEVRYYYSDSSVNIQQQYIQVGSHTAAI